MFCVHSYFDLSAPVSRSPAHFILRIFTAKLCVCVCSRHFLITIFSSCLFSFPLRPCVFPHHTLFSFHVVSRFFFHFRVPYPVFLTDGLSKIDYYRLSFHLLADFCYSHLTSLFAPSPLTHTHISLVSLRLLLLLMLLLRPCRPSKKGLSIIQAHSFASTINSFLLFIVFASFLLYFEEKKQYSLASIVQKVDRSN